MVRSTLALAAVLSVASLSLAADLFTPLVFVGYNHCATCKVVNITSAPVATQVQMIGTDGTVLADSGGITLAPSQGSGIVSCPSDAVHCRFVNANIHKVRADLTVFLPATDDTDTTVVPAQ